MMGDRLGAGKERKNMLKVNNLTKVFSLEKSIFSKERNSFKAVNEVCLNIKEGELPIAEEISKTVLSIPIYYGMNEDQISYVIKCLNDFK